MAGGSVGSANELIMARTEATRKNNEGGREGDVTWSAERARCKLTMAGDALLLKLVKIRETRIFDTRDPMRPPTD